MRHVIAFGLIALLIVGGIVLGVYLRYNSRDRLLQRQRLRDRDRRKAPAERRQL